MTAEGGSATLIVTHAGLRGRTRDGLRGPAVENATRGLVELLRRNGLPPTVGVARDGRPSGERLAARVIEAAAAAGADVVDFGMVSTPAAKLAARRAGLGGAVVVTGSHLAPDWNGVKLVTAPHYVPIDPRTLPSQRGDDNASRRGHVRRDVGAARGHVAAVRAGVDAERIRASRLRVSCAGGAGPAVSTLLDELGCRGEGPGVDVGLRLDADGDRLELVDERGAALDCDLTLALVVLAREPRTVVKGADTSRIVDDLIAARGGRVRAVPPGEVHLVSALLEGGGELAGEGNGGVVVPDVVLARDGLAAAAAILDLLARSGARLSALAAELPRYARRRSTVPTEGDEAAVASLSGLAAELGARLDDPRTGVAVPWTGESWGMVRQSATEPVIRVTVEARTREAADELHRHLLEGLRAGTCAA
jgi:phosphomannomutase